MKKEITGIIVSFIKKEIQRKIKAMIEGFLKTLLLKPRKPAVLEELINKGLIDKEGVLTEGTAVDVLMSRKYSKLFKEVASDELVNAGLLIKETIEEVYRWKEQDYQSLINEALREKGILEITLGEIKKRR